MTLLLALCACLALHGQSDSLLVVSWNVENLFDWKDDGGGESDHDFSTEGNRRWTKSRFYAKCNGIAKTLLLIASEKGRLPDAIAFMEVENGFVMRQILHSTVLRKLDYEIIHYDSPDRRGIDCALLYRKSRLKLLSDFPAHLYDSSGAIMPTRDILVAEFDNFSILVNHHPSKVGSGSAYRRKLAMSRMTSLCDSLEGAGTKNILCVGDFNDDLWKESSGRGTIKYNGAWEKIDGYFSRGLTVHEHIFDHPLLSEPDTKFGGLRPRRSYLGLRWHGGLSDHYPIVLDFTTNDAK